jgi:hypothetical protein
MTAGPLLHHWSDEYPGVELYLPVGSTIVLNDDEECLSIFIKVRDSGESRDNLIRALEACIKRLR